jgi:hypothetical protein
MDLRNGLTEFFHKRTTEVQKTMKPSSCGTVGQRLSARGRHQKNGEEENPANG